MLLDSGMVAVDTMCCCGETGACCDAAFGCGEASEADCINAGNFFVGGPCADVFGCCAPPVGPGCVTVTHSDCDDLGWTFSSGCAFCCNGPDDTRACCNHFETCCTGANGADCCEPDETCCDGQCCLPTETCFDGGGFFFCA